MTELTQLLGPSSQERVIPPLLGLEKADLLELMPPSEVGDRQIDIGTKEAKGLNFSYIFKHFFLLSFIIFIKMIHVYGVSILKKKCYTEESKN